MTAIASHQYVYLSNKQHFGLGFFFLYRGKDGDLETTIILLIRTSDADTNYADMNTGYLDLP